MSRQGSKRQATGYHAAGRQDGNGAHCKSASLIFVLLYFFVSSLAFAAAPAKVDVESLASKNKAKVLWQPVEKRVSFYNTSDTVKFAVGLPFATINKKTINLSEKPELVGDHLWISLADANQIQNLLNEAKQSAQTKPVPPAKETAGTREVKTIVIDPGHGGKDPGASGKKSQEKDIVLAVAKILKKKLEKKGFNVKLTRNKDTFIELGQRSNLANQWDGDLFLSLHCNAIDASPERKKIVQGYHFYVLRAPESEEDKAIAKRENDVATLYGEKNAKSELTPLEWFKLEARLEKYKQNSYMLAEALLNNFEGGKIHKLNMGVGGAGFMVLVGAMMPAVLIELGFISNLDDEAYMMSSRGQQDLANRIAEAINSYKAKVHNYRETLGR